MKLNRKEQSEKKISKWIFVLLVLAIIVVILGVVMEVYLSDYYHSQYSLEEYPKNFNVDIAQENSNIIIKGETDNGIGIIFYPGGKVEYTAYIPILALLAEQGYTCFISKMPGNLAVFGVEKADDVMTANPNIENCG